MSTIHPAVIEFMESAGWRYTQPPGVPLLHAIFECEHGTLLLVCLWRGRRQELVVRAVMPFAVPEQRLPAAAEFLARTNFGLSVGAFELDFDSGEVAYRAGVDVEDDRLSPALVRNLVNCCLSTGDYFLPSLALLASGSPKEGGLQAGTSYLATLMAARGLTYDPRRRRN